MTLRSFGWQCLVSVTSVLVSSRTLAECWLTVVMLGCMLHLGVEPSFCDSALNRSNQSNARNCGFGVDS